MTSINPKFFLNRRRQRRLMRNLKRQGFTHKEFKEWLKRNEDLGANQNAAEQVWRKDF